MDPVEQLEFNSVKYTDPVMMELGMMAKNDKAIDKKGFGKKFECQRCNGFGKQEVSEDFVSASCCNASKIDNDTKGFTTNNRDEGTSGNVNLIIIFSTL